MVGRGRQENTLGRGPVEKKRTTCQKQSEGPRDSRKGKGTRKKNEAR